MSKNTMTKEETQFGLQLVGWLGGESFLNSNLQIKNLFVSFDGDIKKVDIRWQRRQLNGINGMVLLKTKDTMKLLFTNYGKHGSDKRYSSKVVKTFDNVLSRQVPDLFEEATGFDISILKK